MDKKIEIDLETVHPPPRRPDAIREGRSMDAATAEAHEREALNEEAVDRELIEKKVAGLPRDNGQGGSWQLPAEKVVESVG